MTVKACSPASLSAAASRGCLRWPSRLNDRYWPRSNAFRAAGNVSRDGESPSVASRPEGDHREKNDSAGARGRRGPSRPSGPISCPRRMPHGAGRSRASKRTENWACSSTRMETATSCYGSRQSSNDSAKWRGSVPAPPPRSVRWTAASLCCLLTPMPTLLSYVLDRDLQIALAWTVEEQRRIALTGLRTRLGDRLAAVVEEARPRGDRRLAERSQDATGGRRASPPIL